MSSHLRREIFLLEKTQVAMLRMKFGCQASWDSVDVVDGFTLPKCAICEEPLGVR